MLHCGADPGHGRVEVEIGQAANDAVATLSARFDYLVKEPRAFVDARLRYEDPDTARSGVTFPAVLSARLMDLDSQINRVFTLSNTLAVRRQGGWPPSEVERLSASVSEFFLFYTGD